MVNTTTLHKLEQAETTTGQSLLIEKMIAEAAANSGWLKRLTPDERKDVVSGALLRTYTAISEYDFGDSNLAAFFTRQIDSERQAFLREKNKLKKKDDSKPAQKIKFDASQPRPDESAETAATLDLSALVQKRLSELETKLTDEERLAVHYIGGYSDKLIYDLIVRRDCFRNLRQKLRVAFADIRADLPANPGTVIATLRESGFNDGDFINEQNRAGDLPFRKNVPMWVRLPRMQGPPVAPTATPEQAQAVRTAPDNIDMRADMLTLLEKWLRRHFPKGNISPEDKSLGAMERYVLEVAARSKNPKIAKLWHRAQARAAKKVGLVVETNTQKKIEEKA